MLFKVCLIFSFSSKKADSPCGVLGGVLEGERGGGEDGVCVIGEEDTVLTDWCATVGQAVDIYFLSVYEAC